MNNKQLRFLFPAFLFFFQTLSAQNNSPDYSLQKNWAALPFHADMADVMPNHEAPISDSAKEADVFFIHPTTFFSDEQWNADMDDPSTNRATDRKPIKYQASIFNESTRVYAPRYRQATIGAFFKKDPKGKEALEFAYQDVKKAFQYYLAHYNNGRPIIIASHSQGTVHAKHLLQEFFDTSALKNKLVIAYIVGFSVFEKEFKELKPCKNPMETGCYAAWGSFKEGTKPEYAENFYTGAVQVNPVSWLQDTIYVPREKSLGSIFYNLNKKLPQLCATQVKNGYLAVNCHYPIVRRVNNLHIADYNLFYYDVRADVKRRIGYFWKK